ncbi:2-succinylbenzoate-CoA ligase, partial [Natrinema soli]
QSLLAHCADRLAGFKRPKTIGFADGLPRTASGTVDRDAVRDRLLEDGIDAAESP